MITSTEFVRMRRPRRRVEKMREAVGKLSTNKNKLCENGRWGSQPIELQLRVV
jgi:hypothetical protein